MNTFIFTRYAKAKFDKLETQKQKRVLVKLRSLKEHPQIFTVLKTLSDFEPASHRLRIRDLRVILKSEGQGEFLILDIGHRREIYK